MSMFKMDDSEHVCPLCCEELDISDREFYPCKCGYQVCMWCWHRIRESETGLCPACRTPYGEDPHQFTALDVEEVLKANKEAQAAAKRERHQLQHYNSSNAVSAAANEAASGGVPDQFNGTTMEIPKDRTQLANMRVIRRNLIYAVGLPPSIANEDTLRKPEYFGQYGKIAKIVLNRSQAVPAEGGDPRRASASAYVTFQHKEDTLACILALDGFCLENRNIRASYGTSKYCSAFIKNVRCNNPECTYLHEMGATEDTFTKQEIQAGYVTSGRDVLARQQQIVAEQLQQQLQSATEGHHLPPRKRVGGGGPSGTGKASANPVFPPPEFDESARQGPPMPPPPSGISRAATTQANQQAALLNRSTISAKPGRSTSVGAAPVAAGNSPLVGPANQVRKPQSVTAGTAASAAATTAASVVAGGRSLSKDSADAHPHSMLTALTPLKRTSVKGSTTAKAPGVEEKLPTIRNGKKQNGVRAAAATVATTKALGTAAAPKFPSNDPLYSVSSIGGDVIGPPLSAVGNASAISAGRLTDGVPSAGSSLAELGGVPIPIPAGATTSSTCNRSSAATLLGGDIFTGSLSGQMSNISSVNSCSSLLGGSSLLPPVGVSASSTIGSDSPLLRGGNEGLWAGGGAAPGPGRNGVIGSHISNNGNSSSALASILGINLPTGSGSLQESSSPWSSTPHNPPPQGPSPLSMLNGSAFQQNHHLQGDTSRMRMVGPSPPAHNGSSLIGGVPIGGGSSFGGPGTIGAGVGRGNQSDIALLQSLLPGVHITSDNNAIGFGGGNSGWAAAPGHSQSLGSAGLVGGNPLHPSGNWVGGGSNRMQPSTGGSVVGAIGQNNGQQNQNQGLGIW